MAPRLGKQIPEERLTRFMEAYIACEFRAAEAARAIGMSKSSAHANAHRYVRAIRSRVDFKTALRGIGLDPISQAQKLKDLRDALMVKWNAADEDWDTFDDGHLQLEAVKEINKLLDAYPAEKQTAEPLTINLTVNMEL